LPARDEQCSRCVVNEAEVTVVRRMFAWLPEEGLSTAAVSGCRRMGFRGLRSCATVDRERLQDPEQSRLCQSRTNKTDV